MTLDNSIFFYIYAPAYRSNSAGIRVLYELCRQINLIGGKAWMVIHNPKNITEALPPNCPILSDSISYSHFSKKSKVVVVYSETVVGNPLKSANVVRYFLNYKGALSGPKRFSDDEYRIAYTENIAKTISEDCQVLFIPAVRVDELPEIPKKQNINLVYAGKYRAFIGEPKFDYGVPVREVFRDGRERLPRNKLLELLAQANRIYVWENSTIATEAILLQTPVIFIKTDFLGEIIAEKELGQLGYTFENSNKAIDKARKETLRAREIYIRNYYEYPKNIQKFLLYFSKSYSLLSPNKEPIIVPKGRLLSSHRVRLFFSYVRNMGFRKAFRVLVEFGYVNALRLRERK